MKPLRNKGYMNKIFCRHCGEQITKSRYPGAGQQADGTWNDGFDCAENGPAAPRCRIASHGGPVDWDEEAAELAESAQIQDFLESLAAGRTEYPADYQICDQTKLAAKQILSHIEAKDAHYVAEFEAYKASCGGLDELTDVLEDLFEDSFDKPEPQ